MDGRSARPSSSTAAPTGSAERRRVPSVMGALVAVGERVGVRVVEQRVVSITPGELLQGDGAARSRAAPFRATPARAGGPRLTLVRMRR